MSRILEIRSEGYNCAETLIKIFNEEKNLNIPVSIGTPFGSGMCVAESCGAVTGALIVIGAIEGRESADKPNDTRKYAKEIIKRFKEKYGSIDCGALKRDKISCNELIEFAYNTINEII